MEVSSNRSTQTNYWLLASIDWLPFYHGLHWLTSFHLRKNDSKLLCWYLPADSPPHWKRNLLKCIPCCTVLWDCVQRVPLPSSAHKSPDSRIHALEEGKKTNNLQTDEEICTFRDIHIMPCRRFAGAKQRLTSICLFVRQKWLHVIIQWTIFTKSVHISLASKTNHLLLTSIGAIKVKFLHYRAQRIMNK